MVNKFRLTNAKPVFTPTNPNCYFSVDQCPFTHNQTAWMQGVPYSKAIGSVLWPAVVLRPDVAYAVGILSQFIQNPGPVHWEAVKQVTIYLGTTKNMWLTFRGKSKTLIEGFYGADWASQKHQHLILGYVFHFGQGAISWSLKKQYIIMLSSTEAEYIAQMHAKKEGLWLWGFMSEIWEMQWDPIIVNCNNQGAIALSKDNKFHACTKHIDLWYHFIREAVKDNKITVNYILTDENVSDIFTKALLRLKFVCFVEMLGLKELKKEIEGE